MTSQLDNCMHSDTKSADFGLLSSGVCVCVCVCVGMCGVFRWKILLRVHVCVLLLRMCVVQVVPPPLSPPPPPTNALHFFLSQVLFIIITMNISFVFLKD